MKPLHWQALDASALAALLRGATLTDSRAVGASTVYQLQHDGRHLLAVALPDGQAVVVETAARAHYQRRSVDRDPPATEAG